LTPQMVPPGSSKKVWWKCSDGHEWKALVSSRTGPQKCGCPVCAGRFNPEKQKWYEKILAESQRLGAD